MVKKKATPATKKKPRTETEKGRARIMMTLSDQAVENLDQVVNEIRPTLAGFGRSTLIELIADVLPEIQIEGGKCVNILAARRQLVAALQKWAKSP